MSDLAKSGSSLHALLFIFTLIATGTIEGCIESHERLSLFVTGLISLSLSFELFIISCVSPAARALRLDSQIISLPVCMRLQLHDGIHSS